MKKQNGILCPIRIFINIKIIESIKNNDMESLNKKRTMAPGFFLIFKKNI